MSHVGCLSVCQAALCGVIVLWLKTTLFVGQHDAPDVIGQVTFEGAPGRCRLLALGDFLLEIVAPGAGAHPDLNHSDGVERAVELPVAVA